MVAPGHHNQDGINCIVNRVVLAEDPEMGISISKQRRALRHNNSKNTMGNNSGYTGIFSHRSRSSRSTLGSSSAGSVNSYHTPHSKATPRKIWYGRWLFFALLCLVAAVLGYKTFSILSNNETRLADNVFTKVAENAINTICSNQEKKKLGMNTLATVIGGWYCIAVQCSAVQCIIFTMLCYLVGLVLNG